MEFPHISEKINDRKGLNLHAGLLTASRIPLNLLGSIDFDEGVGIEGMFSNKDAALWEGNWEGAAFQIVSTQLQGHVDGKGKQEELPETRRAQLRQFRSDLLDPHTREQVPQIICGDFSIDSGTEDYKEALRILGAEDGLVTGAIPHTAYGREKGDYPNDIGRDFIDQPEPLDYILLRRNGCDPAAITITRSVRRYIDTWKAHGGTTYHDLAYRYALGGHIEFTMDAVGEETDEPDEIFDPTPLRIATILLLEEGSISTRA